ncbi:MAG: PRC-barrel domain-containing protein [Chloroflexi bacterium]|nr:PRC-barrel domain-containing protein [Chloroflexota bacterium]
MQFKEGTMVYTADGERLGTIERFVLDPRARRVIGLVVRKGLLFTEDKVIPVDSVAVADEDRVQLAPGTGGVDDFPPYEEEYYLSPDNGELRDGYDQAFYAPVYYYPPLSAMGAYGPIVPAPAPVVKEQNIPDNTVAVKQGADVISSDGEQIGRVQEVYTDSNTNEVTHFSIAQGLIFPEEKLIPASWVESASESSIHLAVSMETLRRLGEF